LPERAWRVTNRSAWSARNREVTVPFELDRALGEGRLRLGPLSLGGVHQLLGTRLGLRLSRARLARVQESSGGNPFLALEVGRAA
jgi:hypothetical protein